MENKFKFGRVTGIDGSCSVVYQGKMLVFGGWGDFERQISEIKSKDGKCGIQRIKNVEMPKEFYSGGCNIIKENEKEYVLLCFSLADQKSCYR